MLDSERENCFFRFNETKFLVDSYNQLIWSVGDDSSFNFKKEMENLEKINFFKTKKQDDFNIDESKNTEINYIVINPSTSCNLSCWYCYSKEERNKNQETLSVNEICEIILKFLNSKKSRKSKDPISFSLYYNGEITLNFPEFLIVHDFVQKISSDYDFNIQLFLPPTNFYSPSVDFVEFINKYGYLNVSVDFENKKQIEAIKSNIKSIQDDVIKHCLIPVNSISKNLFQIYNKFLETFDKVSLRPVRIEKDSLYPWNKDNLKKFEIELELLVRNILSLPKDTMLQFLHSFGPSDYFIRYFDRIIERKKIIERCPAASRAVAIDSRQNIYPCSGLSGYDEYKLSIISDSSIDSEISKFNVYTSEKCSSCLIRFYCGGPCLDWINKENLSLMNFENSSECKVNFLYFKAASYLALYLAQNDNIILREYAKKKKKEYRLNYELNFVDFAKLFTSN